MNQTNAPNPDLVDRFLRTSRRGLMIVLACLLIAAATLIAHALRPGSLLADWPSKAPGLIPTAIILLVAISGVAMGRRQKADKAAAAAQAEAVVKSVLEDEFRQSNLLRAQRLALIVVLAGQIPLTALALSSLPTAAAVTVMATTTVTLGMATLIVSFLYFDRE